MTTTPSSDKPSVPAPPPPALPTASFSRTIAMVGAAVVAVVQIQRGFWFEAAGLAGLSAGLFLLRLSSRRPFFRWVAVACFAVTAAAVIFVLRRDY